jgi:hypothetical protein
MPRQIWIVFGATGEYEDKHDWMVAAYFNEGDARAHADAALRFYHENNCFDRRYDSATPKNPFDPGMGIDYTGTTWDVYPVTLHDAFVPTQGVSE